MLFAQHTEDHRGERLDYRVETSVEFNYRRSTEFRVFVRLGEDTLRPQDLDQLVDPIDPMNPPVFTAPLDFDSRDGRPVDFIALLASPPDRTGPHIQALARISRLMLMDSFRSAVGAAVDADELWAVIERHEK